jgi:hypothetical protein
LIQAFIHIRQSSRRDYFRTARGNSTIYQLPTGATRQRPSPPRFRDVAFIDDHIGRAIWATLLLC